MIALNEILNNKEYYKQTYHVMGKRVNLEKIISLEQNFIVLDKKNNENRARCNKLCSQVADLVNENKNTDDLIKEINQLDKTINCGEKRSKKAMKKINRLLKKLHNIPLEKNLLNEHMKTTQDEKYSAEMFLSEIHSLTRYNMSDLNLKSFINSQQYNVLKAENLPLTTHCWHRKHSENLIVFCNETAPETLEKIINILSLHSKFLIKKSIKFLKKDCSKEILSTLSNGTIIKVEFLGEYVSREKMIKFYDKNLDMTKFVNMIRITIHKTK